MEDNIRGGILETAMLICFGCSWPINLVKNYKCRSAKGMSLPFILLLIVGYVAGICAKFIIGVNVHNAYVLVVYLLNLAMVTANQFVYFRNRGLDRKAELCVELDADDPAMELVAASVADKVQQRSKSRGAVLRPKAAGNAGFIDYIQWGKTFEE